MKNSFAALACGLLVAALVPEAHAQPKALFFPTNLLPPPNGTYISPAQYHALYASGIIISNVTHRAFTYSLPPPPLGTSATHTFNSELDFDLSLNDGASFTRVTAPAQVTVNLQAIGTLPGGEQVYNTEMLQLNISGGTLPANLQVRASKSLPSGGQTTITPTPGGFMISSFFDIFTELSLDGGNTWSAPSTQAGHMDLRPDPTVIPPVPEPTGLVPPPSDAYVSPATYDALYAQGIVIKNVRHKFFTQSLNLQTIPVGSAMFTEQFGSIVDCQISLDGGVTFTAVSAPANVTVTLQAMNSGPPTIFDAEMTQLDITLAGLQKPVMLRESPTLPSYGETALGQASDGSFRISSFFDIFTELSLDGGNTWQPPTNGPAHVELQRAARLNLFNVPNMPPTNGQYDFPGAALYAVGTSGVVLSNVALHDMSPSLPLPPPGVNQLQEFICTVSMLLSLDNGQTFLSNSASASGLLSVSNTSPTGSLGPQYYNTMLQQLNISGGSLPPSLMIRQSPTKPSLGRTSSSQDTSPTGGFRISSFFDVFTDLSLDGGNTWTPVLNGPSSVILNPWYPPYVPYTITCPANMTVFATSPSGAYVFYTFPPITIFPDCPFCCFTATGTPPSGSLFPIGTTTVTGHGSDGCGEHPTCSFTVTVLPSLIYSGLAALALDQAHLTVNTNLVGTNQTSGTLVLSNFSSGGTDGFQLYLGSADSALLNFQPFPTTANCPTDFVTTAIGPYGSDPNHVLGVGTYLGGPNPMISADFSSLGSSQLILEVHDENNHLVLSSTVPNNALIAVNNLFPPPCTNQNKTAYSYGQSAGGICYRFCIFGCNCLGTNCYIERIACFRPGDVAVLASFLGNLQLRGAAASPPGSFAIQSEELGMFGLRHNPIGQATFEAHPGILIVNPASFIDPTNYFGASLDLNNVGQFEMMLAPTLLQNAGAGWQMSAYGQYRGWQNWLIGTASLNQLGQGDCVVQDDWSPLGSSMTRLEFYQGSQMTGSLTLPNSSLGRFTSQGNLIDCGVLLRPSPGFKLVFDSTFTFVPQTGGSQFTGNEIHLLAANPNTQVQGLAQLNVQARNIGQFAILSEIAQPTIIGVLRQSNGSVEIDGQGAAGTTYQLQAAPTLDAVQWTTIGSTVSGDDGTFHLFHSPSGPPGPPAQQFYHILTIKPCGRCP
jgi:hypothetical protein